MPTWLFTVLGAAAIAAVSITAQIRIRFAPDEATATSRVLELFWQILGWFGNVGCVILLIIEAFSDKPIKRADVVLIALMAAALAFALAASLIRQLINVLSTAVGALIKLRKATK